MRLWRKRGTLREDGGSFAPIGDRGLPPESGPRYPSASGNIAIDRIRPIGDGWCVRYSARPERGETLLSDLQSVLAEARDWLAAQPTPAEGSGTWYGFNNFRNFLREIAADPSRQGMERACHALGRHISDQYGAYEELPTIAAFNDRVRRIVKDMEWDEFKAGPNYRPLT